MLSTTTGDHTGLEQAIGFAARLETGFPHSSGLPGPAGEWNDARIRRTTEVEIEVREPETPDVRIGWIFDRNWELLSPVTPVFLIRGVVRRHFERQVSYRAATNVSRLVSQWEERIHSALFELEREAGRRPR